MGIPKGFKHTDETKAKFSKAHKNNKYNSKCPIKRFWTKIEKGQNENDCWKWLAGKHKFGYGKIKIYGKTMGAHCFSFILHNGKIPIGKLILHSCNNPECCNPLHLYAGTYKDNSNDMIKADSQIKGENVNTAKLNKEQVLKIRKLYQSNKYTLKKIALLFRIGISTVHHIVTNNKKYKHWKHI